MHDVDYYFGMIDAWRDDSADHEYDRGHALIIVAWIERVLEFVLNTKFTREFDKSPWRDRLFGGDERGAIEGFSGKIVLGYALGLYSEQTREDLQQIRHIRNVFAHSMADINFNTPEIANGCHFYAVNRIWGKRAKDKRWLARTSTRHRFITAIFLVLLDLWALLGQEDDLKARPPVWRPHKLPAARSPSPRKLRRPSRRIPPHESQTKPTP
jgi:hypothetical protein